MARERFMMTLPHDLYEQMEKARGKQGRIAFVEAAISAALNASPLKVSVDWTSPPLLEPTVAPDTEAQVIVQAGLRQQARVARTGGEAIGASRAYRCPSPGCEYSAGSNRVTCPRHGYRLR